jgi:pyruvate/2-oxoglutarate dehydrogenase complex dihydrolipoamide acyltransferase (E2) component
MDLIGKYQKKEFSKYRQNIVLITDEGFKKHSVHALIDVDVTKAREIIKKLKNEKTRDISLTGWIVKCIAKVVSEYKEFNTYKFGKKKTVTFDDVDIPIPVERIIDGKKRPMVYIIRKANEKSIDEITKEIRDIQIENISESTQVLGQNLSKFERFVLKSPIFLKKIVLLIFRNNGLFKKKHFGTIAVSAIGMKGRFPGWAIPLGGVTAAIIVVGGITKKPGVVNDKICIREFLHLTITVDHDLIDGGPLARFVDRLNDLVEAAYFLE